MAPPRRRLSHKADVIHSGSRTLDIQIESSQIQISSCRATPLANFSPTKFGFRLSKPFPFINGAYFKKAVVFTLRYPEIERFFELRVFRRSELRLLSYLAQRQQQHPYLRLTRRSSVAVGALGLVYGDDHLLSQVVVGKRRSHRAASRRRRMLRPV